MSGEGEGEGEGEGSSSPGRLFMWPRMSQPGGRPPPHSAYYMCMCMCVYMRTTWEPGLVGSIVAGYHVNSPVADRLHKMLATTRAGLQLRRHPRTASQDDLRKQARAWGSE